MNSTTKRSPNCTPTSNNVNCLINCSMEWLLPENKLSMFIMTESFNSLANTNFPKKIQRTRITLRSILVHRVLIYILPSSMFYIIRLSNLSTSFFVDCLKPFVRVAMWSSAPTLFWSMLSLGSWSYHTVYLCRCLP